MGKEMKQGQAAEVQPVIRRKDEFTGEYIEQPPKRDQAIVVGSKVIMTRRYEVSNDIIGRIWTVIREPRYERGARVVYLDGYDRPYPADGLKVVG